MGSRDLNMVIKLKVINYKAYAFTKYITSIIVRIFWGEIGHVLMYSLKVDHQIFKIILINSNNGTLLCILWMIPIFLIQKIKKIFMVSKI